METKTQTLKEYAGQLRLSAIQDQAEELIRTATEEKCSYLDFSLRLLEPKSAREANATWNEGTKEQNCQSIMT